MNSMQLENNLINNNIISQEDEINGDKEQFMLNRAKSVKLISFESRNKNNERKSTKLTEKRIVKIDLNDDKVQELRKEIVENGFKDKTLLPNFSTKFSDNEAKGIFNKTLSIKNEINTIPNPNNNTISNDNKKRKARLTSKDRKVTKSERRGRITEMNDLSSKNDGKLILFNF
ncbi:MAG: hypothetical protein MJ252_01605 [archaeon]|nr:hypothetical protein [archaeon]